MLDTTLQKIRKVIPTKLFNFFQPAYHWSLSFVSALWYRFPSRYIKVIGVTGTKGKSSTVEILNAILEEAGYKTALSNTIRFKVGDDSLDNLYKMSMPGRFFVQRLLRRAVRNECDYIIMEMTSQGSLLYRHRFIEMDALVFTNISPEHIEAHGSYENYVNAKLAIAKRLEQSKKSKKSLIVNDDDKEAEKFMAYDIEKKVTYSIHDVEPYEMRDDGVSFTLDGRLIRSRLQGLFNIYNILSAVTTAKIQNVSFNDIVRAIENFYHIPGRVQKIKLDGDPFHPDKYKQDFEVIVDYAHTPDSLEKLYATFPNKRKICVLGGTGGGRDRGKRQIMGGIADKYCDEIILTDEDPYDEDPQEIVADVAEGITTKKPSIIMDRREAIKKAINIAKKDDVILITGKGTDPYIMGPDGSKVPWSDAEVAREELEKWDIK